MSKARPMDNCAFCGGYEQLTREHVWGKWVAKYASPETRDPLKHTQSQTRFAVDPQTGEMPFTYESQIHSGSLIRRRLPVACANCNNGWMSRLEAEIEDLAVPLMQGHSVVLDRASQQLLALWLDKTACVYEFSDLDTQIATPDDRDHMRRTQTPAPNTEVWVGQYSGDQWLGRIRHFGASAPSPTAGVETARVKIRSDVLVIGGLFGYVIGADSDVLNRYDFSALIDEMPFLQRIWPVTNDEVAIPGTDGPITDAEALDMSDILARWGHVERPADS